MRFWQLLNKSNLEPKEAKELSHLESALSRADVHAVPAGVRGMSTSIVTDNGLDAANKNVEYALHKMHGYSKAPRRPLLPLGQTEGDTFMAVLEEVLRIEATLA
jgi:4-hydroxy-2-oxoglutarate aldolase